MTHDEFRGAFTDPWPVLDRVEPGAASGRALLSVVVPCFNEEVILPTFHARLGAVLEGMDMDAEIVYIDDGSSDGTEHVLRALHAADPRISVIELSRNFGKEVALTAGLDRAEGDAVVVIDADLQDPPELIPQLVAAWRTGADVVFATRLAREGESVLKRLTAYGFYRLARLFSRVRIPDDTGDFRLLSRRAVRAMRQLRERNRFMKGLFAWIGFRQLSVPYRRQARAGGKSKWNYAKLWRFALDGITSFTSAPLKLATYFGGLTAGGAFLYAGVIIVDKLAFGNPVPGYPSLMVVVLFLGGVQLISIGIIGEYLGRLFEESKGRPLYLVQDYRPATRTGLGASRSETRQLPLPGIVGPPLAAAERGAGDLSRAPARTGGRPPPS
jgi:polyisoprenyl-phosphate glycosyltransferase